MPKKIVLVGGCFDILHYGHISFLKKAKSFGDSLVVALESDRNVKKLKGKGRPIHSQKQRKHMLESLSFVDKVILLPTINTDKDYDDLVLSVKPSVIAATHGDQIIDKKKKQAESIGASFVVIPKVRTPSTSRLVKLLGLE